MMAAAATFRAADARDAGHARRIRRQCAPASTVQIEPIARADRVQKLRLLHLGEHRQHLPARGLRARSLDQPAAELRERLEHEHARHERIAGKVIAEIFLVGRDLLVPVGGYARLEPVDAVNEYEAHGVNTVPSDSVRRAARPLRQLRRAQTPHATIRQVSSPWTVLPLVEGSGYSSTSTLLTNGSLRVVVDTGLSYDSRELKRALAERGLEPDDVNLVINTHLHVDHCGNNRLFRRARILMSRAGVGMDERVLHGRLRVAARRNGSSASSTRRSANHQLSTRMIRNVARMARFFWKPEQLGDRSQIALDRGRGPAGRPGRAARRPATRRTICRFASPAAEPQIVAGDAVLNESPDAKVRTMIPHSQAQFVATRDALLRLGLRIIPGHGPAFVPRPTAVSHGSA